MHDQPPSLARPRCRPPMMTVACSMVVRRPPSAAVLCTAFVSCSLIFGASSPIDRASMRIGTTSATTTRTITPPITYPRTQPKVLVGPAASAGSAGCIGTSLAGSDCLAEVPDGLQARVDRRQPVGNGAGQVGDGGDAAGDLAERRQYGAQVENDAQQPDRGDGDDQRGDDDGE